MSRAGLLAPLLALAFPAGAYVRTTPPGSDACLWWEARTVVYRMNELSATSSPGCEAGTALAEAVRRGFDRFSGDATLGQSCTDLSLVLAAERSSSFLAGLDRRPGVPNENLVVFRNGWCTERVPSGDPCWTAPDSAPHLACSTIHNCFDDSLLGRDTLALTTITYDGGTGRILDADLELAGWDGRTGTLQGAARGWYFTCEGEEPGPLCGGGGPACCTSYGDAGCASIDLENVVTHEAGHFIGLGHVSDEAATMYASTGPGDVSRRSLEADDVAGLCDVYPAGAPAVRCVGDPPGGCGCGSAGAGGRSSSCTTGRPMPTGASTSARR